MPIPPGVQYTNDFNSSLLTSDARQRPIHDVLLIRTAEVLDCLSILQNEQCIPYAVGVRHHKLSASHDVDANA